VLPERIAGNPTAVELDRQFPDVILDATESAGQLVLTIPAAGLTAFASALKSHFGFERVSGITGVDWWPRDPRFEIVYLLHSVRNNLRLRLKVGVSENEEIDSLCPIWRGANWYEREVFDLFGVRFRNHPNLERIMMPTDWEGYPLRKDYPVHGHKYSYQDE
jgi:NADH-quinone oxidoreductase subunit C